MKVELELTRKDLYFLRRAYGKRPSRKMLVKRAVHEVCRREAVKLVEESVKEVREAEAKLLEKEPSHA